MAKKTPVALLLLASALLFTSCAAPSASPSPAGGKTPPASSSVPHLTGQWLLTSLNGAAPVAGSSVTAYFGADGVISGSGGCNRYNGTFTQTGSAIKVNEGMASTMMMCDEAVMAQETAYFKALAAARAFAMNGTELARNDETGKAVAKFAAQAQKLAGSSWTVTAYNNGKQAVTSVLAGTKPTVAFSADGTVSGSAGCNSFNGSAVEGDGTVKLGPLASTRKMCPSPEGVMTQETALLAALETAATFKIEGDRLELRTADNAIAVTLQKA